MTDIFDLDDISDITKFTRKQLKLITNLNQKDKNILALFEKKNRLTMNEIIVGLFRMYDIEVKRTWVANRLYALSQTEKIKKIPGKRGTYIINN